MSETNARWRPFCEITGSRCAAVFERTARGLGGHPRNLLDAARLVDRHGDVDDADRGHAVGRVGGLVDVRDLGARAREGGSQSVNTSSRAMPVSSTPETSSHALGWPPHSGTTNRYTSQRSSRSSSRNRSNGISVTAAITHPSADRRGWIVLPARTGRHRRQLDGGIRLAVGAEDGLAITDTAVEHHPSAVGRDRRLAGIGDNVRDTVHGGRHLRRHLTRRGVRSGGRYDDAPKTADTTTSLET